MKRSVRKKINFGNVANNYILRKNDLPENFHDIINIDFQNKNVLDIACGGGNLTNKLYNLGANIIGIDISDELIEVAKIYNNGKNIKYESNCAENLLFENETFDIITVMSAWHWLNREKVNNETWRTLKENGLLIVMNVDCLKNNIIGIERDTFNLLKKYCNICYSRNGCKKKIISDNIYPQIWINEWINKGYIIIDNYKYEYNIEFKKCDWENYIKSTAYYSSMDDFTKILFNKDFNLLMDEYNKLFFNICHLLSVLILKKDMNHII